MTTTTADGRPISSWHLRSFLTLAMHDAGREVTVDELVQRVHAAGVALAGRPSKTVSDALRSPLRRGWIRRVGRGRYLAGPMPKSTKYRHRERVRAAYAAARTAV
jgi:predicted transcriptional regulator of viral defense system